MGKKRRILLAILLVVVLGGFAWWLMRPREPSYRGKSLSEWLEEYTPSYGAAGLDLAKGYSPQAQEAIRRMGTNAIPFLLAMARATDSPLKIKMADLLDRQDFVHVRFKFNYEKRPAVGGAIRVLGDQAQSIVPDLSRDYQVNFSAEYRVIVDAFILGCIGPSASNAIPALLRGVASSDMPVRLNSVWALGEIHGQPELAVPALLNHLHASGTTTATIYALGEFGSNAAPAVPELIKLLNDHDKYTREMATNALKQIDPEAAARAGVK